MNFSPQLTSEVSLTPDSNACNKGKLGAAVMAIEFSSSSAAASNCFFSDLKWSFNGSLDIKGASFEMQEIALTQTLIR